TADLAGQVDAQRQPDGPRLVKGQQLETPPLFSESEMGEFRSHGATFRRGSSMSRVGPGKTLTACRVGDAATRGRVPERAVGVGETVGPRRSGVYRGLRVALQR